MGGACNPPYNPTRAARGSTRDRDQWNTSLKDRFHRGLDRPGHALARLTCNESQALTEHRQQVLWIRRIDLYLHPNATHRVVEGATTCSGVRLPYVDIQLFTAHDAVRMGRHICEQLGLFATKRHHLPVVSVDFVTDQIDPASREIQTPRSSNRSCRT